MTVGGHVGGTLAVAGTVTIAPTAVVEASIREAGDIVIQGRVRGDVAAEKTITLAANADVTGELSAPRISINPGARIKGRLSMELALPRGF